METKVTAMKPSLRARRRQLQGLQPKTGQSRIH